MRKFIAFVAFAMLVLAQPAQAATVGVVQNFGPDLSSSCSFPEGVAVDPRGNVYASSLNFAATAGPANICVLDRNGTLIETIAVAPGPSGVTRLLGMLFVAGEGLYVGDIANFTGGRVLRVNTETHAATVVATGFAAPNAFERDHRGNLWVSDSFLGAITKIAPDGAKTTFAYPTELAPRPGESPPFGANGLAFDRNERYLYVAVTSRDEIYRIAHRDGALGAIELFAKGVAGGALDGADGIAFDVRGNLYVCSNQSDEIAVLSPEGNVIAEIKGTGGNAFNSPASLVFKGRSVYVTNLSLFHGGPQKLSVFTAPYPGAP